MAMVSVWILFTGRRRHAEIVVLGSCLVLLVIDPWLSVSWGFALSAAATLGLVILPRWWHRGVRQSWWRTAVTTAVAATLATLPLLLAMGKNPSYATIPANVFAEVFVAPATISGVVAGLVGAIAIWSAPVALISNVLGSISVLVADVGVVCCHAIVFVAQTATTSILNIAVISWSSAALIVAVAILWRFRHRGIRFVVLIAASLLLFGFCAHWIISAHARWPDPQWRAVACDVGQGDATVFRLANNSALVIDVGR